MAILLVNIYKKMAITQKILVEYKKQNPTKYALKFGKLDPMELEGIIGYTEPTPQELEQGIKPKAIWKTYDLTTLREMGEVKIIPAKIDTKLGSMSQLQPSENLKNSE